MNTFTNHTFYPYHYFDSPSFHPGFNNFMFPFTHPYMNFSLNFNPLNLTNHHNIKESSDLGCQGSKKTQILVLQKLHQKSEQSRSKNSQTIDSSEKTNKRTPNVQKENRNVASNLLRIFFKNILELNSYDHIIILIIEKNRLQCTLQSFLKWLQKFKINYKNYIKPTELKRILGLRDSDQYQKIFRILLRDYMKDIGLSHCLTSKRIENSCLPRHLEGLRKMMELGVERRN